MDDAEIRERLIAYVSAEPPRTLTVDAILRAGRRARRMNRLRVVTAVAVLTATAAVVPAVLLHQADAGRDPAPATATVDHACAAAEDPPRAVRDSDGFVPYVGPTATDPDADALIDRRAALLRCAITDLITSRLTGFQFHQVSDADATPARTLAPFEVYVDVEHQVFESAAVAVDGQGAVTVGFTVTPASDRSGHSDPSCPTLPCHYTTAPGGWNITVYASETSLGVTVYFEHSTVQAWMFAQDLRHWHSQPSAPPRTELPLTVDQLIDIATDPRLDIFGPA